MGMLCTRMEQDLVVRGRSTHSRRAYVRAVSERARYYRRSPAALSERDVKQYLVHLLEERRLSAATCQQTACALRFFYEVTLGRSRRQFSIPLAKEGGCLATSRQGMPDGSVTRDGSPVAVVDGADEAAFADDHVAGPRISDGVRIPHGGPFTRLTAYHQAKTSLGGVNVRRRMTA